MKDIWRIITHSRSLWRYYAAISVFTILLSFMSLLQPLITGWAIDAIGQGTSVNVRYVVTLAVALFVLELASTLLSNIGGYIGDQMAARLRRLLSLSYYEHLLTLPQKYFDTELSGKIVNRLSRSITQLSNFMQMLSNNFLQFIFSTLFALVAVAIYSWPVALMLATLYPIYVFMTYRSSGKWQRYQAQINEASDLATGRFTESISQIKVVKSYVQQKRELAFFKKHMNKIVRTTRPQSSHWHRKDVERRVVLNIIFFGVTLYIFVSAANGALTPGQAVALILYAMQIRIPIFTISFLVDNTQRAIADSRDYFAALAVAPQVEAANRAELRVSRGLIEFENVQFAYDKKPVLRGISFQAKPDQKLALVGESGEGKTTITNLLIRLYAPQSGQIRIDGQDVQDVTLASLRSAIGIVFQEPALFSGTIFENIAYACPSATMSDVEAAARAANAHEFITKFDKAYDTEIGERGLKLSGGQKQRIAIARAILKDAPILILDEATSSLDGRSEALVQQALKRLMKGRTTLIIAHRLSTIAEVDTIVTLKNGRVDETGTPDELATSGGIYEQLLAYGQTDSKAAKKRLKTFELTN